MYNNKLHLFDNCKIYTPRDQGEPLRGEKQGEIFCYPHGAMLIRGGNIEWIGNRESATEVLDSDETYDIIDLKGQVVIPGFVDPHTHNCFSRLRENEFEMRIGGISYLDILKRGGGILSSVKHVRETDVEKLYDNTYRQVETALRYGTTTMEIKSGYGLSLESELKMLEAIGRVQKNSPVDIVPTFLGAHAIPVEFAENSDGYVDEVIEKMLPAVCKQDIAVACDVFCEKGVFSHEQSRQLLMAAKSMGLAVKLHADEVHDLQGGALAAELNALSADHLLAASDRSIEAMADKGVIGTLLPNTAYSLRKPYARARDMIRSNLSLALATDCNPGSSYTESMQFVIGLAVMNMEMSPAEALTGATLNSAYALGMANKVGSLDNGKQADFLVLEGDSPAVLAYHCGVSSVVEVYKKGMCLYSVNR